jgi:histone deacetylase complex regulatory component SIN3
MSDQAVEKPHNEKFLYALGFLEKVKNVFLTTQPQTYQIFLATMKEFKAQTYFLAISFFL